jgi:integrase
MRGHVRKRGRSWCFVIDIGRDPETQKRRQRWRSGFPTKAKAEESLRRALGRLDAGDDPMPTNIALSEFAGRWLGHLEAADSPRPNSRRRYAELLYQRVVPVIGGMRLDRIRPAHVQAVLDAATEAGLSPATVHKIRAAMSSMFNMAVKWTLISSNPVRATSAPKIRSPKLVTPSGTELRTLADAAIGTTWEVPILLATTTGARRAEILGLRWSRVDLERGRVRIDETLQRVGGELAFVPPKTDKARREIPLPAFALERLRAHKADQARRRLALSVGWSDVDLVCERGDGKPLDPDGYTHGFARIAKSAGLEGVRLHDCRHGVATALAKAGTPAYVTSKVLGHSSVHFTANVYQHADEETVDRALAGLETAFADATGHGSVSGS